jgi:hypothetical protein
MRGHTVIIIDISLSLSLPLPLLSLSPAFGWQETVLLDSHLMLSTNDLQGFKASDLPQVCFGHWLGVAGLGCRNYPACRNRLKWGGEHEEFCCRDLPLHPACIAYEYILMRGWGGAKT